MKHHQLKSIFFPFFHEKMLNLAGRRKKRCVKIEKNIGTAGSFCMDQSYFRFLFRLARKSKQSGLSKSEKRLPIRNATKDRCSEHYNLIFYRETGINLKKSCSKFSKVSLVQPSFVLDFSVFLLCSFKVLNCFLDTTFNSKSSWKVLIY